MKRIVLVVGCLWSLGAWAQAFEFSLASDPTQSAYFVNATGCADTLQLSWVYRTPVAGTATDAFFIWATESGVCGDSPAPTDQLLATVAYVQVVTLRQGTFEVPLASLAMFDGGSCPATSLESQTRLCGSMPYVLGTIGGSTRYATAAPFPILYDADPPAPPLITLATAGDSSVELEFAPSFGTSAVLVDVLAPGSADFQRVAPVVASNTRVSAVNLQNGVEYRLRLIARDPAGNESAPSNEVTATPVAPVVDAGAPDDTQEPPRGCTTAPGLLVALAALWLRRTQSA